ncbi:tetratricopeptide repeat protein [Sphingomonas sp. LHG3406-1]|uniref:tetratricopeptide repeat protein n=1 Tax=Sphingomonas sp. LHG3406-1 TaxID=2804617 RepID=UPI0026249280|nr:tetratricopeptide repeat protein [Sphingomonas sp. LHG3406-1]
MKQHIRALVLALAACTLVGAEAPAPPPSHAAHAGGFHRGHSMRAMLSLSAAAVQLSPSATIRLHDGMGGVGFPITTASPDAQRYFDQGLAFAYGFNHAAAIASFREAQRRDPACAMCWWGEAFAHGPNINAPMDSAVNARAFGAAAYADWLARKATPVEQALTAAMARRYALDPAADRAALDRSFADAMLAAARAHPAHDDLALVAAEAAMNTRPWDYWAADKQPKERIADAVRLVETVLARSPDHPQAAHLYVHLMENGPEPGRAEAAADRLDRPLAPALGHLVHMPAHIYYVRGRWQDSIRANMAAARADEAWIRESGDKGLVRYGYYPHNVHFIVASAQMAGEMTVAIREARKLDRLLDPAVSARIAWIQAVNAAPYFAAAQFASPAEILAMKAPDARLPYPTAMRFYARAVARARQRDRAGFDREIARLRAIGASDALQPMIDQGVPAKDLVKLAEKVARARWAQANRQYASAVALLREAAAIEQSIPYMEPPYWYYPVNQSLGAALFQAGRYEASRAAFATALAQSPNNGWVLHGLAASERALGRHEEATRTEAAFRKAWSGDRRWLRMDRL